MAIGGSHPTDTLWPWLPASVLHGLHPCCFNTFQSFPCSRTAFECFYLGKLTYQLNTVNRFQFNAAAIIDKKPRKNSHIFMFILFYFFSDIGSHLFKLSWDDFFCEQIPNICCILKSWMDVSNATVHCTWRSQRCIQTLAESSAGYYGLAFLHFRSFFFNFILFFNFTILYWFCHISTVFLAGKIWLKKRVYYCDIWLTRWC